MPTVNDPMVVTGTGLITPVGHDSISASSAIRAGISRFQEIPELATTTGATYTGAVAYGITDGRSGSGRLLSMAIPAVKEALYSAEEYCHAINLSESRMIISLPPLERPSYDNFEITDIVTMLEIAQLEDLQRHSNVASSSLDEIVLPSYQEDGKLENPEMPIFVEIIREGNNGGVKALEKAENLLRKTSVRHCIVGAVDSLVEFPALAWLDEAGRIKTEARPYGFIPGEAAAFLVVELESEAARRGAPTIAEIMAPVNTIEEAIIAGDLPLRGRGLSEAILGTLVGSGVDPDWIICDLNGEYNRTKEWALALGRVFAYRGIVPELWHPAENIGDIGAASALVFTVVAIEGIKQGYFPGDNVLIWTSSDSGGRGALMVGKPTFS